MGGWHQIAGDLMDDEAVEGHVLIEGPDHPVAVAPGLERLANGVAGLGVAVMEVGVAYHIEPVAGPALSVCGRGQQPVDYRGEGRG